MREELAICRHYQISHSHWEGGPDKWTSVDRAYAVAYERWLNAKHGPCGTSREDWFEDDGRLREEPTWEASIEECVGCIDLARAERAIDPNSVGLYVTMRPFGTSPVLPDDEM